MRSRDCMEAVFRTIRPEFRSRGFRRRGYHWRADAGEAQQVISVSPDGRRPAGVTVMLGVYWRTIPPVTRRGGPSRRSPRIADCHFRTQLAHLLPLAQGLVVEPEKVHLENRECQVGADPETVRRHLLQPMAQAGFPWLERFSRLDWAIRALRGAEQTGIPMGTVRWMYTLACLLATAGEEEEAHYMAEALARYDPLAARAARAHMEARRGL